MKKHEKIFVILFFCIICFFGVTTLFNNEKISWIEQRKLTTFPSFSFSNLTDKKYYDDFFEKVWKSYPRKVGKSAVTQKTKKELYEAGEEVVLGAVNSYIAEIQENGTAERYIMYGSTFFNVRWRDYIKEPEPCVEVTAEEPEEKPIDLWSEG